MRHVMEGRDGVLFLPLAVRTGVAGLAEVASKAYVDPTQFDPKSPITMRNRGRRAAWFCVACVR